MSSFAPGTPIIIREMMGGKVWTARPVTVVQDTPQLIVLYMAPGTWYKHPRLPSGQGVPDTMVDTWVLVDQQWVGGDALYISPPNAPYTLMLFWNEGHSVFQAWYINIQEPYRRTTQGFDYLDLELDLVIESNRTEWQWKDEAKFARLQEIGRISPEQAMLLRAEATRLLRLIQDDSPFFGSNWERWPLPTHWPIPQLPFDWERIDV